MDSSSFHTSGLIVIVKQMIGSSLCQLLSIYITKEIIFFTLMLPVSQILFQNFHHCLIQWNNKRFSVLGEIHINHMVIEIYIFYFDIFQTPLSHTS